MCDSERVMSQEGVYDECGEEVSICMVSDGVDNR